VISVNAFKPRDLTTTTKPDETRDTRRTDAELSDSEFSMGSDSNQNTPFKPRNICHWA